MGTQIRSAQTQSGSWNAFDDVEVFVDAVLAEIAAMKRSDRRLGRRGPKGGSDNKTRRRIIMAVWCVCFSGLQWRTAETLTGIPATTMQSFFTRWNGRGLWRRLLTGAVRAWRLACGNTAIPSAVAIDSRSCRSAPTCGLRGIDGGKKIKGIKLTAATDKHGSPLALRVTAANVHDTVAALPVLDDLKQSHFTGTLVGDLGYRGKKLQAAARKRGMEIVAKPAGDRKKFLPQEIRWTVERTFAWLSRYRRLNTIVERTMDSLIGFVEIALASILIRRLARIKTQAV